jgi:hypothetical protein
MYAKLMNLNNEMILTTSYMDKVYTVLHIYNSYELTYGFY